MAPTLWLEEWKKEKSMFASVSFALFGVAEFVFFPFHQESKQAFIC